MDPIAVPYAVSKKLVENARIRHDWAAMYVTLKGNDQEYYVDAKVRYFTVLFFSTNQNSFKSFLPESHYSMVLSQEFDMLFEDFGGFDALYLRMLSAGIPTAVQLMWIPLSELDISQQFLLMVTLCRQCFTGLWRSSIASRAKDWTFVKIRDINDDIMMMIVFPVLEFVIPYEVVEFFSVII